MYKEHLKTVHDTPPQTGYWLKLGDAAYALGVSEITLRRKLKCGKLAHDFRGGKYYVYLHKDEATGRFFEPDDTPGAPEPPFERAPGVNAPTNTSPRGSTLPSISLRGTRQPHPSDWERKHLQQRVWDLEEALGQKDAQVQGLRRTLEDQQTLIAFLEDTISQLGQAREASTPSVRDGQRPFPKITQKRS